MFGLILFLKNRKILHMSQITRNMQNKVHFSLNKIKARQGGDVFSSIPSTRPSNHVWYLIFFNIFEGVFSNDVGLIISFVNVVKSWSIAWDDGSLFRLNVGKHLVRENCESLWPIVRRNFATCSKCLHIVNLSSNSSTSARHKA